LLETLPDKEMLTGIHTARPVVRLLHCWPEIVPEWHLFLDVPDIVFQVEQDIDGDGAPETIYDQGYFDVNWNLSEPTTDVVIEAWPNAICVPCGPDYKPCTKTGIVGLGDLPAAAPYLSPAGYAARANRPKPNGIRPAAETPFCRTVRVVGCPDYGAADYYKAFYSYESGPETHFRESWYVYQISTGTSHHVVPDASGFYDVLTPPSDFFPYHTLVNWRTANYPDGVYELRVEVYDGAKNPIGGALPTVKAVVDNSRPEPVDFTGLRWRVAGTGAWNTVPLYCPIIHRPTGKDIELAVDYNVAATHLRDMVIRFLGCAGSIGSDAYWHETVAHNNRAETWTLTMPATATAGAYRFYLEGRSRAYNGNGGLATNWFFDPLHIWRGNSLYVAVLDS